MSFDLIKNEPEIEEYLYEFEDEIKPESWLHDIYFLEEDYIMERNHVLAKLIKKYKDKIKGEILEDFLKVCNNSDYNVIREIIIDIFNNDPEETFEHYKELLDILIWFGADITAARDFVKNELKGYNKPIEFNGEDYYSEYYYYIYLECLKKIDKYFDKVYYGRKIAKFIKEAINDEFEFKPLRAKLDLKKYLEIINE